MAQPTAPRFTDPTPGQLLTRRRGSKPKLDVLALARQVTTASRPIDYSVRCSVCPRVAAMTVIHRANPNPADVTPCCHSHINTVSQAVVAAHTS